jgi:hypothetical protein
MSEHLVFPEGTPIDVRWNAVLHALPAIGKNAVMTQGPKYSYRSIDAVLDHLHPLFAKFGLHVFPVGQQAVYDSYSTYSGTTMFRSRITVDWQIRSVDGEVIYAQTMGTGTDAGDKETSKAQTMAFKYLLWPSTAVAENDDPDGTAIEQSGQAEQKPQTEEINGDQIPIPPPMQVTRTGPGGVDASTITEKEGKRVYAMAKSAHPDDDVKDVVYQIIGRSIKWTSELSRHEFDQVVAQLKADGA